MASLYLEPDQFIWYHWICIHRRKNGLTISCSFFIEEIEPQYSDSVTNKKFGKLAKLKQIG